MKEKPLKVALIVAGIVMLLMMIDVYRIVQQREEARHAAEVYRNLYDQLQFESGTRPNGHVSCLAWKKPCMAQSLDMPTWRFSYTSHVAVDELTWYYRRFRTTTKEKKHDE